ncbi:MAG: peptidoglycan domain protein [Bacteroidetes bacterium]|nr:peptidoglycan domain protein [Bacteroidota bacterium]
MADVNLLAPKIFKWEGGFVNDPVDMGGATNMGVTLATWRQVGYDKDGDGDIDVDDIRLLTRADATIVLKKFYWDRWKADQIKNQSVANILVDWVWGSGKWGIVIPQRILNLDDDGNVGPITIKAVNSANQKEFHGKILEARKKFIDDLIASKPSQERFRKGWLNRMNDYTFAEG